MNGIVTPVLSRPSVHLVETDVPALAVETVPVPAEIAPAVEHVVTPAPPGFSLHQKRQVQHSGRHTPRVFLPCTVGILVRPNPPR